MKGSREGRELIIHVEGEVKVNDESPKTFTHYTVTVEPNAPSDTDRAQSSE